MSTDRPRTVSLVVNPTAGKGRAQAALPQVAGRLRDAGYDVAVALSRDSAEAADLIEAAVRQEPDVVAVMGGDGMLHLGLNAVAEYGDGPALGLIPAGTGNDLARGVGLDDIGTAVAAITSGRTRPLDLLRASAASWDDRYVGSVVSTGFDALVARRANAMSRPRGSSRYTLAVLAELPTFRPLSYRLVVDGQERALDAMLIAVGNTRSYGGGLQICPAADPYDGWLDVTIIHPVSRLTLLRLLPKMKSGRFATDPCVEQLRARSVTVEGGGAIAYGDGEELGAAPFTLDSCPGAIRICG